MCLRVSILAFSGPPLQLQPKPPYCRRNDAACSARSCLSAPGDLEVVLPQSPNPLPILSDFSLPPILPSFRTTRKSVWGQLTD